MIIAALFLLLVITGYTYQLRKLKRRSENGQFLAHHLYFEPSSYNESTPVLSPEEPLSSPFPWWFDATSPGSDSVFTSPHPQEYRHSTPGVRYPQSSPTVFSDSNLRFIPAPLRCNPNLRQEALRRASVETATPQTTTVQNQLITPDWAKNPRIPRVESDSDTDNEAGPDKVVGGPPPLYESIYP